jgi:hypothetical protein
MSFGDHFGQHMPIATHRSVGDDLTQWPMGGVWHVLAKMAAKTHLS